MRIDDDAVDRELADVAAGRQIERDPAGREVAADRVQRDPLHWRLLRRPLPVVRKDPDFHRRPGHHAARDDLAARIDRRPVGGKDNRRLGFWQRPQKLQRGRQLALLCRHGKGDHRVAVAIGPQPRADQSAQLRDILRRPAERGQGEPRLGKRRGERRRTKKSALRVRFCAAQL